MATREEILNYIIESGIAETCFQYQLRDCKQPYWREELHSEMWLWLCEYDLAKLADAYEHNHLNALITRYLQNQWRSKNSRFHYAYRKHSQEMKELTQQEEKIPDPDIK